MRDRTIGNLSANCTACRTRRLNSNNNGNRNRRRRSSLTAAAAASKKQENTELSASILNLITSYNNESKGEAKNPEANEHKTSTDQRDATSTSNNKSRTNVAKKPETVRFVIDDVVIEDEGPQKKRSRISLPEGPPVIIDEECDCVTCRMNNDRIEEQSSEFESSYSSDSLLGDCSEETASNSRSRISKPPNYTVYDILCSQLKSEGRQIDAVKGDGNCFFRAVSKEVYGTESCHEQLRQAIVDVIEKYPRDHEQFLEVGESLHDHIIEMRKPSSWSTTMEIYAAATLFQRDIYVFSPNHDGMSYRWLHFSPHLIQSTCLDTQHDCHIGLCHTNGNHYDRIAPLDSSCPCNCCLSLPRLNGRRVNVDLTAEH